ncbi:UDP-N-acetylmuramoyl-tripeptide--D-alanyl-D-alanine ligase [Avibacterium paragallinarum]|uniref:UDP-N-acetylmuramoyl-tripeptide--D-alanyl-D-alanine ligase n=1 Tax=Avibacterium paragallinarum TaxID=728 RepID=A0A0F5F0X2_AVIPA|nr:UDP-N-acetylmuramoyl-tripeptide--D-alanyl-D-alanine ligase [Avibacterium paragallinarum]KAA6209333.1 UDP-N-acetylmuramoyl-tripeptide--D-alanyl-D-alanine ligase [Avibacterium paragallinarum]KKB02493.1 UDP-N-acetylmuramoyl-tripeptide--D-alanyl-D-alanine ligase [Avibacterium paragallinarum]RZN57241.1 UDP-N-acetylmuramoyl-tripeptide--D-alanyl-D-alanine ligase [Avibacterium paragallinarum]RZN72299.1 UDP-N-acetylmuramoyl-tripeptide--D-alanyl-D-alanine ligase [Avibacterium paragallinarum]SUU98383.
MIKLTTQQLAEILHGTLHGDGDIAIENVSTDTRQANPQGLFFALRGERFDGHQYLAEAVKQGALAAVVDHQCELEASHSVPQIVVVDTRLALGRLGQWLKAEINPLTVAITGSSGKTTVKEMTASILQQSAVSSEQVLFTQGNFNNDIGVPLTLLRLTPQHKFAVIELGANHLGEIAYTTNLVRPNVAMVNNVAAAHLEGFGSLEGVAQAKGEIYQGLASQGIALINLDCHYLDDWQKNIGDHQVRSFSLANSAADFYASDIQLNEQGSHFILHSPQGNVAITLPYLGEHNISNALAAAALAMSVGATLADVQQGLAKGTKVKGRLFPLQPCDNLLLLDDTYNANVDSLQSAIQVLQKYPAFRILVVGDMAELGENTQFCHQQVGEVAKAAQLDYVVSYGEHSAEISAQCGGMHFTDQGQLVDFIRPLIAEKLLQNQNVVLLAKGSRRMQLENVIELLKDSFQC